MNGHSRLCVLSGSKLLAVKALRTRLKGSGPAQVWARKDERAQVRDASGVTFVVANADHQTVTAEAKGADAHVLPSTSHAIPADGCC